MKRFEIRTIQHYGREVYQIWDNKVAAPVTKKVRGRGIVSHLQSIYEARVTCAKFNDMDRQGFEV